MLKKTDVEIAQILLDVIKNPYLENNFKIYKLSKAFDIYHYKGNDCNGWAIELAMLRALSQHHYHTNGDSIFLFPESSARMHLGSVIDREAGVAVVASFAAAPGKLYHVPAYYVHAAGPLDSGMTTPLFILNKRVRKRSSGAYTDDTVFLKNVQIVEVG